MRLKTLNGAPLCEHLDFSPDALLDEEAAIKTLFDRPVHSSIPDSTASRLKWRLLPSKGGHLRTGWSQPYLPQGAAYGGDTDLSLLVPNMEGVSELPPDDTSDMETTLSEMDGFAQHSLIFHETLVSSQIAAGTDDHTVSSSSFMNTSFASMSSKIESQSHGDSQAPILQVPSTLTMTALSSLPSADALRAIYPQTPTHNLLCVLTTQPEDREILVKKGKYRMHLREVTVADDTRSDFKVSFWSRPSQKDDAQNVLFNTLSRLKVGDILLLRNIALNAFRDNVYGQSLNLSITRARTTVEVLMSDGSISSHQLDALPATIVGPFMKVKKWAKTHVAPDIRALRKRKQPDSSEISAAQSRARHEAHDSSLPPDTMEGI